MALAFDAPHSMTSHVNLLGTVTVRKWKRSQGREHGIQAPDKVWVACRLQQLQPEEGEDGRLQQLHQAVYLHQHLHPHGQISISCDDITGMAVGPRQEAQAQHGPSAVAPAAVQAVEEVCSSLGLCGFSQQAPQGLCLLAAQMSDKGVVLYMCQCCAWL